MGLRQSLRIAASTLLLACGLQFAHADGSPQTIVFGVAPGPYGDMVKQAIAPTLKEKGYKVVVREFSDYVQPNMALANGSIDANLFQHTLYFDKFTADKGLKLSKLIVVPTAGMGFYSRKINSLDALKKSIQQCRKIVIFSDITSQNNEFITILSICFIAQCAFYR
ncbi:MetQ/NlpA family ABC transporter substrate-binding protein, partial [Salmonella enterica subsp. enterica serovar Kentucky]|nr:MetQ/NlpA family ABC transporter substrate-binding protein [Salmonella enterica subsp. enterica serovar Kentucky]